MWLNLGDLTSNIPAYNFYNCLKVQEEQPVKYNTLGTMSFWIVFIFRTVYVGVYSDSMFWNNNHGD